MKTPEDIFIDLVGEKGEAWISAMLSSACGVHADQEDITAEEWNTWQELSQECDSITAGIATALRDEKKRRERDAKRPVKKPAPKMVRVHCPDEEPFESTMEEFITANEFGGLAHVIRTMAVGETLTQGGGDAPVWTVERIS